MLPPRPALSGLGGLLVLLALGLPWSHDTTEYIPGFITPSTCIPTADGTMWCSPAFLSPGMTTGSAAAGGADSPVRVFLVAGLVLLAVAAYRSTRRPLLIGGVAVLVGVVLAGPTVLAGPISATAGGLLMLRAGTAAQGTKSRLGFPRAGPQPTS